MSRFTDEIHELPEALLRMVAFYRTEGLERLAAWTAKLQDVDTLVFSGMGTSEFVPLAIGRKMAEAGIACTTIDTGEWLHYGMAVPDEHSLVVLISQSGESVEIKRLVENNVIGSGFVAITNNEKSTLGAHADLTLPLCAGDEASISTKTYTNSLGLLYLLAATRRGSTAIEHALSELEQAAECILSAEEAQVTAAAEFLLPGQVLIFVGRGPAYAIAKQCALTFMEGVQCLAGSFSGGAFRHGPFESIGPDSRLVIFAPAGRTFSLLENMGREAATRGVHVVFVTDTSIQKGENIKTVHVKKNPGEASEDLFPIAVSGTHPRLLDYLAKAKGIEAGTFRYCSKVTAHE
jgi:glucosamine--fructose-6-phosphate aminotransferase (isomerizing)